MRRLDLGLFGGFRARLCPGDAVPLPTRKSQALLAYLAVAPGRAQSRDTLAALLWGDMSQKQARGNLRQVLAGLRRALKDTAALRLEGQTVTLDPARVSVDVGRFEQCAAEGTVEALAEAAALYQGDVLAGLTLQEPPFEEWLLGERERLRERAMEVAARLLALQRSAGQLDAAIQSALKLLTLDPLQEPVHRTLMRLYAQRGRRSAALRQYQTCVGALERELHAQPEPETKALYQQILTQRAPTPSAGAGPAPASADEASTEPAAPPLPVAPPTRRPDIPPTEIPLVGRDRELARLTALLDAACAGHGRLVGLLGDPGVGKSRLGAEAISLAGGRGARVLVGRCFETEQRLPFAAWVDALRSSGILGDPAVMAGLQPVWRSELARLLPELGESVGPVREGSDPLHLFEAIAQLVERVTRDQPVAILLEDTHWMDEMSLRLLAFMARRTRERPVLLVATLREDEVVDDPRHRHIGDELVREGLAVSLRLAPLSRPDTIALARQMLPPGSAPALGEAVWRTSEGNAFMAVETARVLTDQRRGDADHLLPRRVRALVTGRLDRLSPRARRLVAVGAVIGRQFEFPLLQRAGDLSEEDAAEAMEELVRRRIFQQSGDGFEFTHDRIREVIYDGLLPPQRKLLHRRVAEALEALHGGDAPDIVGALAFHYRDAAAWPRAVHSLSRSGEQAARRYAHADAALALQHALEALGHTPVGLERDRQQLTLSLRRAQSLYFVGQWTESAEVLVSQTTLLARTGDPSLAAPWYAWLGYIYVRLGEHERARGSARQAIAEASRAQDDASSGKAYGVLAFESFWSGRPGEGVDLGERAVALLEGTPERWWLGMAHFYVAFNEGQRGRFREARAALRRMHAIGEAIADNRLCSYAAWATGWTEALEGRHDAAIASCRRALDLATDPVSAAYAAAFLGYAQLEAGDGAGAAPRLAQAVENYRRFRFRTAEAWFGALLADALRLAGKPAAGREVAARAGALAREIHFPLAIGLADRALGRLARVNSAGDEAERRLGEALETFRLIGADFESARTLADLGVPASAPLVASQPDPGLRPQPGEALSEPAPDRRGPGRRRGGPTARR